MHVEHPLLVWVPMQPDVVVWWRVYHLNLIIVWIWQIVIQAGQILIVVPCDNAGLENQLDQSYALIIFRKVKPSNGMSYGRFYIRVKLILFLRTN